MLIQLSILICLYVVAGFLTANAHSVAYDKSKWWSLWMCVLLWPLYVVWAIIGLLVEGYVWVHNRVFPKDEQGQ
jgi:Na+/proline symporter